MVKNNYQLIINNYQHDYHKQTTDRCAERLINTNLGTNIVKYWSNIQCGRQKYPNIRGLKKSKEYSPLKVIKGPLKNYYV